MPFKAMEVVQTIRFRCRPADTMVGASQIPYLLSRHYLRLLEDKVNCIPVGFEIP
jgi:hypothetical protein